jgi:MFS family permease
MMTCPETDISKMNGLLQTFTGIGMLVGPILGSVLFRLGGYTLPFYSVAICILAFVVVIQFLVPDVEKEMGMASGRDESEETDQLVENTLLEDEEDVSEVKFWHLLTHYVSFSTKCCVLLICASWYRISGQFLCV